MFFKSSKKTEKNIFSFYIRFFKYFEKIPHGFLYREQFLYRALVEL